MPTISVASQLEDHRIELGEDYQFVMRCHDGRYGPLARDVAIDVLARETVNGDEAADTDRADAIVAEVRQTEQDVLPIAA